MFYDKNNGLGIYSALQNPSPFRSLQTKLLLLVFICLFEVVLTVFLLESFDAAGGVDEFLLAGVEWVTGRADFSVYLLCRAAGLECTAAAAVNRNRSVFRVYIFFHYQNSPET